MVDNNRYRINYDMNRIASETIAQTAIESE